MLIALGILIIFGNHEVYEFLTKAALIFLMVIAFVVALIGIGILSIELLKLMI